MLGAYVFAAIVGWVMLGASLFGAHHGGGHAIEQADHATPSTMLLSLRLWSYLLAFGGTSGVLLRLVAHAGEPLTLLASLGVGSVCGVGAHLAWQRLGSAQGGILNENELAGQTGRLLLAAAPSASGMVRLTVRGQSVDLIAASDEHSLPANEEVLVVSVRDGVAHVVKNPAQR